MVLIVNLDEFRPLEDEEAAIVNHGGEIMAIANRNEMGGVCDCCIDFKPRDCVVVKVINLETGLQVWPQL